MPIYLDTHIVVWLAAGELSRLSGPARQLIQESGLLISPTVILELQLLYEIDRLTDEAATIVSYLEQNLDLQVCDRPFESVATHAAAVSWTRDPFDRLIVGQAAVGETMLITKDVVVRQNYPHAFW